VKVDPITRPPAASRLPRTTARSAPTSSDEYGSIDGGSWNRLATAPLSRR
jgi:hypothetical protein